MSLLEIIRDGESHEDFKKRMGFGRQDYRMPGGKLRPFYWVEEHDYQNLIKYRETARKILKDLTEKTGSHMGLSCDPEKWHPKFLEGDVSSEETITHFKIAPYKDFLRIRRPKHGDLIAQIGDQRNPFIELVDEEILFGFAQTGWGGYGKLFVCKYNGIDTPKFEGVVYYQGLGSR